MTIGKLNSYEIIPTDAKGVKIPKQGLQLSKKTYRFGKDVMLFVGVANAIHLTTNKVATHDEYFYQ